MNVGCLPLNIFVYIPRFLSLLPSIQLNASNFLAISTHTVVTNLGQLSHTLSTPSKHLDFCHPILSDQKLTCVCWSQFSRSVHLVLDLKSLCILSDQKLTCAKIQQSAVFLYLCMLEPVQSLCPFGSGLKKFVLDLAVYKWWSGLVCT